MARPSFKPTAEQRLKVKGLACIGMQQEHIAESIGLRSPKSLRKHFPKELRLGQKIAIAEITRVCFEMAQSGEYPMVTEFWLNTVGSAGVSSAQKTSVFKIRDYVDQPEPGQEHEYRRTSSGEYMREQVIGPPRPARRSKGDYLSTGGEKVA